MHNDNFNDEYYQFEMVYILDPEGLQNPSLQKSDH